MTVTVSEMIALFLIASAVIAAWLPAFRRKLEASDTAYVEYATALGALVDHHRRQLEN